MNTIEEQQKLLIDILYISFSRSRFIGNDLPIEDVALAFVKLDNRYDELYSGYAKKHDGLTEAGISITDFKSKEKQLSKIIVAIKSRIRSICPLNFECYKEKTKDNYDEINIESKKQEKELRDGVYQGRLKPLNNHYLKPILEKFADQHKKDVDEYYLLFDVKGDIRTQLVSETEKLAKALIKLQVLREVLEAIELDSEFKCTYKFKNIPAACEFYKEVINPSYNVSNESDNDLLGQWIINQTFIYKYEPEKGDSWKKKNFRTWIWNEKKRIEHTTTHK